MPIGERIRQILAEQKLTDKDVAGWLGITPQRLSQKFKDDIWDSISEIETISTKTWISTEWLISGTGPKKHDDYFELIQYCDVHGYEYLRDLMFGKEEELVLAEPGKEYLTGKDIRPITVTVSPAGQELVTYVPVKAQAGYMKGYGDPHFIERLPAFTLPGVVKDATYRMFEVDGDSMLQLGNKGLRSGEIVIAKYVEDIFDMKDNRVFVVISTEGIAIKRVINRLRDKQDPCLVMTSDNKNGQHPTYVLKPKQIKEVWEAKRFISADFSFDTNLYEILGDLQAEQAILKQKVDELSSKKLKP